MIHFRTMRHRSPRLHSVRTNEFNTWKFVYVFSRKERSSATVTDDTAHVISARVYSWIIYTERQKKLITISEQRSLKSTASKLIILDTDKLLFSL